jgi:hypothetical protein
MHVISAGVVVCMVAAAAVGCGSARASHPGSAADPAAPAVTENPARNAGVAASGPASTAAPSACQGPASVEPAGQTLLITLAGDEKTYCVRVGDTLQMDLRSTGAGLWLQPLVSGSAVVPIPGAARTLATGVTADSFTAVRPGHVIMTSVRPPCQFTVPRGKGDLEPAFPLPTASPLRDCTPSGRFSASIIVLP